MTKEQILNKYANISLYTNDNRLNFWIGLAMDKWAEIKSKEVAIAFAEYLFNNWRETEDNGNAENLFNNYIDHLKQQQIGSFL